MSQSGEVRMRTMRVDSKNFKTALAWMPGRGRLEAVPMGDVGATRDWRMVSEADVDRIGDDVLDQCSDMQL